MDINKQKEFLNQALVDNKISKDIIGKLMKIPREIFLSYEEKKNAYYNKPLPIGYGQTISQPYTVAYMTELLSPTSSDKILEIGTGCGYQTAILYQFSKHIYTIERITELAGFASKIFKQLNINQINQKIGDGTLGWQENAPFDKIIVTAGSPEIPTALINQLAKNGKLVIPVGDKKDQTMVLIQKDTHGNISKVYKDKFRFVPLIGNQGWQLTQI